jgi:exosortase
MNTGYSHIIGQEMVLNRVKNNSATAWHYLVPLAAIMGLLAVPVLSGLWGLWHFDKNFDGLLLVPFMCGLIFYKSKEDFTRYKPKQVKPILYLLPISLGAMLVASAYGLPRIAGLLLAINLLLTAFGFLGFSNYRLFAGPLLFLMLMVPPPQLAVDLVTINLQKFFSTIMETILSGFSNLFLERHGFEFWFAGMDYPMVIAPECSGIRSLIGFVIMSSFFGVFDRHSITGVILLISAGAATALVLNFLRILATMQLRLNGLEEYSVGSWHGLLGIAVFMIGCLTLSRFSRFLKPLNLQNHKEDKK